MAERLFVKVTRDLLPQVKDKYPFLYLEHGRLEVDDSSVKWCDALGQVIPLPVATISCLLLGPGTSVTHDAVRTTTSTNCSIAWVGEDVLHFYAAGILPTSDTRAFKKQMLLASSPEQSLRVAQAMFSFRFPNASIEGKNLKEMMGMEGQRVRALYQEKAAKYNVGWKGREFRPGEFEMSDIANKILTSANAHLYGVVASVVHSLGLSPHIGFVHSNSPLPFVYDVADLYKENLCIDLAFSLTKDLRGQFDRKTVVEEFKERVVSTKLLENIPQDLEKILGGIRDRRFGK